MEDTRKINCYENKTVKVLRNEMSDVFDLLTKLPEQKIPPGQTIKVQHIHIIKL